MERSARTFPEKITCPQCDALLSLDEEERRSATVTCPACSAAIPPPPRKEGSPVWKNVILTLVVVAFYRVGLQLPMPGIDGNMSSWTAERIGFGTGTSLFSNGLMTYLLGSALVLLLSGIVPPLRRLRDGSGPGRRRFDTVIYLAALALCVLAALPSVIASPDIPLSWRSPGVEATAERLSIVVMAAGALMLLLWLAGLVTRAGLVNGVALILAVEVLGGTLPYFRKIGISSEQGWVSPGTHALMIVIPVLLVSLTTILLLGKRVITVERSTDGIRTLPLPRESYELPVRIMASGALPFMVAMLLMAGVTLVFPLSYTSTVYLVLYSLLVVAVSVVFVAVTYDPRDIVARLGRFGLRVAGARTDDEALAKLDSVIAWAALPGLCFALVLAWLPIIMFEALSVTAPIFNKELLILAGVSIVITQNLRGMFRPGGDAGPPGSEPGNGWTVVYSTDVLFEGELVKDLLWELEFDPALVSNRVICATGTLAPWEICRPRMPAMIIHPRLAQGSVDVLVRDAFAAEATEALKARGIVS